MVHKAMMLQLMARKMKIMKIPNKLRRNLLQAVI